MTMLNSTIFDCLIYKGYGQRIAERDHKPGGFALELGRKDVDLVLDTARATGVPMNIGSVLHDRWLAAQSKGRGALDWSAVALSTSEDSGIDISPILDDLKEFMLPPKPAPAPRK
jgi:3-hydroxyisobutyrate dehydrogenase-like beta-hydroxyacid dehydrogenase